MRKHGFVARLLRYSLVGSLPLLLQIFGALAQQLPPEVARHGYADTLFVNGKVVSMDDASTSTNVGNIYQAVAIKGAKIVKLGTNAAVRTLAGPDT